VWVRHGSEVGAGRWEPVGAMVAPIGSGERLVGRPRYADACACLATRMVVRIRIRIVTGLRDVLA